MTTRVERVGAGTVIARRGKAHEISATTETKERNIRALLLRKRVLSRGNWRSGAGSAEADSRRPRQKRRKGNIEKPALKHEQEWYRQILPMSDREPDKISKIETEGQFGERQTRLKRAIFTLPPRLGPALDPVLRRPRKIRFVIENRFQNGARVVEGKANAEREQAR